MGTPGEKLPFEEKVETTRNIRDCLEDKKDEEPLLPFAEHVTDSDMTVLQNVPSLGIFIEPPDLTSGPQINIQTLEDLEKQLLLDTTPDNSNNSSIQYNINMNEITSFADLNMPGPSGLQTPKTKVEQMRTVKNTPTKHNKKPQTCQMKKQHACEICDKNFQTSAKLQQHQLVHSGGTPFKCEHCKKSFSSKFKLVRHVLIHSDRKAFSCTVCERTFHRKDHLKNHIKVHSPSKKVYTCDKPNCNKEYTSIMSYRKHLAMHAAEEGSLDCKICSKQFETKSDIMYHLKIHAGSRTVKNPNEKKFTCDHCDRKFFTRKDVRRHLVVHTGTRNFLCQFCPQRFGRKDHLVRHIKKSHSKNFTELETNVEQEPEIKSEINIPLVYQPEPTPTATGTTTTATTATRTEQTDKIKIELPQVENLLFAQSFTELSPMLCPETNELQQFTEAITGTELLDELNVMKEELEGSAGPSSLLEVVADDQQLLPEIMHSDLLRLINEQEQDENNLPLPGFSQVFKQQEPQPPS